MACYFTTRSKEQLYAMFLEIKWKGVFIYLGKDHSSILFRDSLQSVSISGGFIYQGLRTNSASEQCSVFQAQKNNVQSEAALNALFIQSYQAISLTGQLRMKFLEEP